MGYVDLQLPANPFDALAESYDQVFTRSLIGQAQRSAVWAELEKAFRPGDRVVEIGCGTGVDACFLAERGVSVLGCDTSPAMIQVASERVRQRAKYFASASVELGTWPAERIATVSLGRDFDGAFSNFGVLNCIQDVRRFACGLATRLKPGAKILVCLMGPCCLWEIAWFLAHGRPRRALRRFKRGGLTAEFREGGKVQVYYPRIATLARKFAPQFRLRAIKGIGISVPPSYVSSFINRFPAVLDLAARADRLLAGCPGFRVLGDHTLVTFERTTL
jgi:SAM-dependent methyltransferase